MKSSLRSTVAVLGLTFLALSGTTALWVLSYPVILTTSPTLGIQGKDFGFRISWATNDSVVVEACPSLANPVSSPLQTNTLVNGWTDFRDPQWANYPTRFYRVRQL
jgi:hypothetical protein